MKPEQIETLSFKIIDEEAGPHPFDDDQWTIVRRMIHTSADFEYIHTVRFHPEAVAAGLKAIRSGKAVITYTRLVPPPAIFTICAVVAQQKVLIFFKLERIPSGCSA